MNHRLIHVLSLIFFVCAAFIFTSQVHAEDKYWIKVIPTVTGPFIVDVDVQTNIPGSITLSMSLGLNGLKPDDKFIGTANFIKAPITNGRGNSTIDATNPNKVYPHGFPLPDGKYDVEVSFYPRWPENAVQASKLGIKEPIYGKASIQLVASEAAALKRDKPSPQLLEFKKLYLEFLSFKDNPEFQNQGFTWEPAKTWNKKITELGKFSNQNVTFTNEQRRLDVTVTGLLMLSLDCMRGKETENITNYIPKLNKAFGIKASEKKKNQMVSKNTYDFDVKVYCGKVAEVSGGSYQIEETCREQENEALRKIDSMNTPKKIATYCRKVGQTVGGSYAIMLTCINQEIEAKGRL